MTVLLQQAFAEAAKLSNAEQEMLAARLLTELAGVAVEQQCGSAVRPQQRGEPMNDTEKQAARERFERHFGAVNLGYASGTDNEAIDADLARAYSDTHEAG